MLQIDLGFNNSLTFDVLIFQLDAWPGFMRNKFTYSFFEARFPNSSEIDWNTIFGNHLTIKLFLAVRINHEDLFESGILN